MRFITFSPAADRDAGDVDNRGLRAVVPRRPGREVPRVRGVTPGAARPAVEELTHVVHHDRFATSVPFLRGAFLGLA